MRELIVLGAGGGFPTAGEACSGFLLVWDDLRIVLDLGYATLPQLLQRVPDGAVDAVVVTHEHPDHCADLHGLFRLRRLGSPGGPRVPLLCPPRVLDRLAGLEPTVSLSEVFDHRPLPGDHVVGPFRVTATPLPHHVPTVGVRLVGDGLVLAYATDTGPHESLVDIGRDADLFVLDATDRPGETERPDRTLLTAAEAGGWAERAAARRLLLTHLWPATDAAASVTRAQGRFGGAVEVASEGRTFDLGP